MLSADAGFTGFEVGLDAGFSLAARRPGNLIGYLGNNGTYDAMFAVVLTVAFLGFAADRVYQALMGRLLAWRE